MNNANVMQNDLLDLCPESARLPQEMDITQKTSTARNRNAHEHLTGTLAREFTVGKPGATERTLI
jgi:hypothetical protein